MYHHLVAGERIGIAGDIGHAASGVTIRRLGDCAARLPLRQGESLADTAAGRSLTGTRLVPDHFARDRTGAAHELRAATGERIRARGRKINVRRTVALSVARPAVAGCRRHRDTERSGVLERALHRVAGGCAPAV